MIMYMILTLYHYIYFVSLSILSILNTKPDIKFLVMLIRCLLVSLIPNYVICILTCLDHCHRKTKLNKYLM